MPEFRLSSDASLFFRDECFSDPWNEPDAMLLLPLDSVMVDSTRTCTTMADNSYMAPHARSMHTNYNTCEICCLTQPEAQALALSA